MSILAQLVIAGLIFIAGTAAGIRVHVGIAAARELEEQQVAAKEALRSREFNDRQAGQHAGTVAKLTNQLGNAREQIAQLSGRACLDAGTVGMLNDTGVVDGAAAASNPASSAAAAATGTGIRFSTDRDVAGYIALCRTRYAEVSDQVNKILDIEDRRHPPGEAAP